MFRTRFVLDVIVLLVFVLVFSVSSSGMACYDIVFNSGTEAEPNLMRYCRQMIDASFAADYFADRLDTHSYVTSAEKPYCNAQSGNLGRCVAELPATGRWCRYYLSAGGEYDYHYMFTPGAEEEGSCDDFLGGHWTDAYYGLCYGDYDCSYPSEFCDEFSFCRSKECEVESCPAGTVCYDEYCTHIDDIDDDGVPGTLRSTGAPIWDIWDSLSHVDADDFDCYDYSQFCTDQCEDKDVDSLPDCADSCIDVDDDGFCDDMLSLREIDERVLGGTTELSEGSGASIPITEEQQETMTSTWGFNTYEGIWNQRMANEIVNNYFSRFESGIYPFDCDDTDPVLKPTADEVCDFVDNNCDNQIDECSNLTVDDEVTNTPRSCVYTGPLEGCAVWDADDDDYFNELIGCPLCTDCDDEDASINPGEVDDQTSGEEGYGVDNNCNGLNDEMFDSEPDGVYDHFEPASCRGQGTESAGGVTPIVDNYGCWISIAQDNLDNWSDT